MRVMMNRNLQDVRAESVQIIASAKSAIDAMQRVGVDQAAKFEASKIEATTAFQSTLEDQSRRLSGSARAAIDANVQKQQKELMIKGSNISARNGKILEAEIDNISARGSKQVAKIRDDFKNDLNVTASSFGEHLKIFVDEQVAMARPRFVPLPNDPDPRGKVRSPPGSDGREGSSAGNTQLLPTVKKDNGMPTLQELLEKSEARADRAEAASAKISEKFDKLLESFNGLSLQLANQGRSPINEGNNVGGAGQYTTPKPERGTGLIKTDRDASGSFGERSLGGTSLAAMMPKQEYVADLRKWNPKVHLADPVFADKPVALAVGKDEASRVFGGRTGTVDSVSKYKPERGGSSTFEIASDTNLTKVKEGSQIDRSANLTDGIKAKIMESHDLGGKDEKGHRDINITNKFEHAIGSNGKPIVFNNESWSVTNIPCNDNPKYNEKLVKSDFSQSGLGIVPGADISPYMGKLSKNTQKQLENDGFGKVLDHARPEWQVGDARQQEHLSERGGRAKSERDTTPPAYTERQSAGGRVQGGNSR